VITATRISYPTHNRFVLAHHEMDLVEWVGTSTPVGEEKRQADGLEEACNGAYGNGVKRTFFSDNLGDNLIDSQSN
jgi:hypothetical protein